MQWERGLDDLRSVCATGGAGQLPASVQRDGSECQRSCDADGWTGDAQHRERDQRQRAVGGVGYDGECEQRLRDLQQWPVKFDRVRSLLQCE